MAQLERVWTVNHAVSGSSPSCDKLTKSLQTTLKLLGLLNLDLNFEAPCTTIISWTSYRSTSALHTLGKAAWCCQLGRVALGIPPDYTDSSRSGRY